ncbi:MAG: NINE protein [Clostridiales bacterium]|nr:NINE protein [Clostridiales bacterium]
MLCIFLGAFGVHRFYAGKVGTGLLWLFTGSLLGIGWLVDVILLATGSFRDNHGYPLN